MKIKVQVLVEPDEEQVKVLTELAKTFGFSYGNITQPRKLIRRYLESKVVEAVHYCHLHIDKD